MALVSAHPSPGASLPTISSLPKFSHLSPRTSQLIPKPRKRNPNYKSVTSQARRNDDVDDQNPSRRDVLIGLGGLYTAASNDPFALASPIPGPDLGQCQSTINVFENILQEKCCLIKSSEPKPFVLPANPKVVFRQAAHLADDEYYKMFEEAIRQMRSLPDDDPRSFMNQAKIHCAYCNSAYLQQDGTRHEFQVHNSALFFPFHRWYLYFFERICGNLIGNEDFRLPFWNYDSPEGMTMPERYTRNKDSPLYDEKRESSHLPPTVVDLQFGEKVNTKSSIYGTDQKSLNIATMHNRMVRNSKSADAFFGVVYGAGENPPSGAGSIENVPHTPIHKWVGKSDERFNPDMGSFHTAGKDPIFYAHHANIDRMWNIWKSGLIPGRGKRGDLTDPDWLETQFVLYDELGKMVQVKVKDCLDSTKLGYEYDPKVSIPWLQCPIKPKEIPRNFNKSSAVQAPAEVDILKVTLPMKLDKVVKFRVPRPRDKRRSKEEKDEKDEILILQNIQVGTQDYVKFDVFVNDDDYSTTTPLNSEFAGSFVSLEPGGHNHGDDDRKMNMNMRGGDFKLSLTEILEDLDAENDKFLTVTLVPRVGCGNVTVGGIKIDYR